MKRNRIIFLSVSLGLLCFFFAGRNPLKMREKSPFVPTGSENIQLTLADDTLSPTGASFRLWNGTAGTVLMGEEYSIEIWYRHDWYVIEPIREPDWPLTLQEIGPGEHFFSVEWGSVYGELPRGRYRLVKPYSGKPFYLLCEFEIG